MRYKLIIFDIDGTITRHISSWRYIHERLRLWEDIACRYQKEFLAGKISYQRFCELDASHWRGMSEKRIRELFDRISYSKNAVRSIRILKKMGFKLAAVSTGLQFIAEKIKKELGFDYAVSNILLAHNGRLTGKVKINITHGAKGKMLRRILKHFNAKADEVISVGDSEGDIPLMEAAGYSIAFNSSSERLSKIADYNCRTKDFTEVLKKILEVSNPVQPTRLNNG